MEVEGELEQREIFVDMGVRSEAGLPNHPFPCKSRN